MSIYMMLSYGMRNDGEIDGSYIWSFKSKSLWEVRVSILAIELFKIVGKLSQEMCESKTFCCMIIETNFLWLYVEYLLIIHLFYFFEMHTLAQKQLEKT